MGRKFTMAEGNVINEKEDIIGIKLEKRMQMQ